MLLLPHGTTGGLMVSKALFLNLNISFRNRISIFLVSTSYPTLLRGWVDPVPGPILPKIFLTYSRGSNQGSFELQSEVLTTTPKGRSDFGVKH